jgi:hypothetical protein
MPLRKSRKVWGRLATNDSTVFLQMRGSLIGECDALGISDHERKIGQTEMIGVDAADELDENLSLGFAQG